MKNLNYIFTFFLILSFGITSNTIAQNIFTQEPQLVPGTPYHAGQIITIPYKLKFTEVPGDYAQISINYPSANLEFVSSNLTNLSGGVWTLVTSSLGQEKFKTTIFSDPYIFECDFTLSFKVLYTDCGQASGNVFVNFSFYNDSQSSIPLPSQLIFLNSNSNNTVSMELIQGDDCTKGMYKISSFGYDIDATDINNSSFQLDLPLGATLLNVFKSDGNPISVTSTSSSGITSYKWYRIGDPLLPNQTYYALIKYDKNILCQTTTSTYNLSLIFNSRNYCTPHDLVSSHIYRTIANCCDGPIPGDIQGVFLRKSLDKYPLRYFPAPDNCKTHDYVIKIDNLTENDLNEFVLEDFLNDIIENFDHEIEVTKINVSFNSIFPGSFFKFKMGLGGTFLDELLYVGNSQTEPYTAFSYLLSTTSFIPDNAHPNLVINGVSPFPQFSSLVVKITHRLGLPPSDAYNNIARLHFKIGNTPLSGSVNLKSKPDSYEPSITLEKKVSVNGGPFNSNGIASANDLIVFRIKIKNYGMMDVLSADLKDVITNSPANMNDFTSSGISVTATPINRYSPVELQNIKDLITNSLSSLNGTGFNITIPIKAAPCDNNTELVITMTTTVKSPDFVLCAIPYKNNVTLNWNWNGNKTLQSEADVNFDIYKNIMYYLQAKCESVSQTWHQNTINGIPGREIWYKASVINSNNYPIHNFKIMLELPNANFNSNLITPPSPLGSLAPSFPTNTNLHPEPGYTHTVISNIDQHWGSSTTIPEYTWLRNMAPVPDVNNLTGNTSLYFQGTIEAGQMLSFDYKVTVPINSFGSQYITSMGISRYSPDCPETTFRKINLTLNVARQDDCGNEITNCDQIMFNYKIERIPENGNKLRVTLYDIYNAYSGFNINKFDIVVHQPYIQNSITSTPYNRKMVPFELGSATPSQYYNIIPQSVGQRYLTITNNPTYHDFGSVSFEIVTPVISPGAVMKFPINIIFRTLLDPCTICERTIYLTYSNFLHIVDPRITIH